MGRIVIARLAKKRSIIWALHHIELGIEGGVYGALLGTQVE